MTKLFLAMFSIFSLSAVGAVPELPPSQLAAALA